MSWRSVRRWRDRLRDAPLPDVGLSPEGARAAWDDALAALDDAALDAVAAMPGRAFPDASVIVAGTVFTAAIEWLAVLLGRGTRVTLKHPADAPGAAPLLADAAAAEALPLRITGDRDVLDRALVVVMGSDDTVVAVRSAAPARARVLAHGHRFSAAWVTGRALPADPRVPEGCGDPWGRVAADAALHDGRGCLSPAVVFTPLPLAEACDALADALARAEARWPIGRVAPDEGAAIRTRRALARVAGLVREGPGWSVHGLPADRLVPVALPRSLAVVSAPDAAAAAATLAPWADALSTIGTDDADDAAPLAAIAPRLCPIGRMQRPPLRRSHDGEDWLAATQIAVSREG